MSGWRNDPGCVEAVRQGRHTAAGYDWAEFCGSASISEIKARLEVGDCPSGVAVSRSDLERRISAAVKRP